MNKYTHEYGQEDCLEGKGVGKGEQLSNTTDADAARGSDCFQRVGSLVREQVFLHVHRDIWEFHTNSTYPHAHSILL